ncbi:ATP-dependent DNA helicase [Trichonephila clavipes]|nr:ATP-dependent DNA helicase [Trichonephila clavipes]
MDQVNSDLCLNEALRLKQDKIITISGKKLSDLCVEDFRQTLPVIERGRAADEIKACLKTWYLWTKVEKLYLTTNMRVQLFSDVESGAYAQKLLEIGEGHVSTDQEGMVLFTHQFCHVVESEDELIDQVFSNLQQYILDEN